VIDAHSYVSEKGLELYSMDVAEVLLLEIWHVWIFQFEASETSQSQSNIG
jgi:hypothetical protein